MNPTEKNYSLNPISGTLDYEQARHLSDRCLFGAKKAEIDALKGKSIQAALNTLLETPVAPLPPVSLDARDLAVAIGETWVNAVYDGTYNTYRLRSYRAWWIGLMMQQTTSIVEKMVLFWHNHFVVESDVVNVAAMLYKYNQLLRTHALGNIKQLAKEMTISPAMLFYLNGESNKATAPNENYGRELFELFTIGKGPLIADGNYTTYTEADIREAAKVLTGWKISRTNATSSYDTSRHDKTTKVFSSAFDQMSISNNEAEEYKQLVDMIFNKKETARYLARKIYRWLMYYHIDAAVEAQVIEQLANTLYNNNYEIKPMLIQLLSSEHFFSNDYRGSLIKNPIDFTIGIFRKCEIKLSSTVLNNYELWSTIHGNCINMEMYLGDPPDVAGWPEYYKEPSFYQLWINSSTIPIRTAYSDTFCNSGITKGGFKYIIDPYILANKVSDPSNVNTLINGFASILLPVALNNEQLLQLKDIMIPGLTDSTWTFEWNKYISNPNDSTQKNLVGKYMLTLIASILKLPEFYLS